MIARLATTLALLIAVPAVAFAQLPSGAIQYSQFGE